MRISDWSSDVCSSDLLPPMVYVPQAHELVAHFKGVAERTGLPIMLYNNPPAYRTVIDKAVLEALVDVENIVAVKESAPDTRRFTDFRNAFGDRYENGRASSRERVCQ